VKKKDVWLLVSVVLLALAAWAGITYLEGRLEQWQSIHAENRRLKQEVRLGRELEANLAPTGEALERMRSLHREVEELLRDLPPDAPCFEKHLSERALRERGTPATDD